jgi:hypothetical protein
VPSASAPLDTLFGAFDEPPVRARWLPGIDLTVRTATRGKSMRITWPDKTSVDVLFERQGPSKSRVALAHVKLADQAAAARAKTFWAGRLEALNDVLTSGDVENGPPAPTSLRRRQPRRSDL